MPFPVDEQYISAAETKLGVRFPEAFRTRLTRNNGGSIQALDDDWSLYPVLDLTDRKRLSRTANDVVRETVGARKWRGFPQEAVALAGNGSGDQLVFLPNQSNAVLGPAVYFWCHETARLTLVAEDFSQLWSES